MIHKMLNNKRVLEIVAYVFFGGLTTLVNFIVYFVFKFEFGTSMVIANTAAWILSVLFAYVTNKIWVFKVHTSTKKEVVQEFLRFIFYRLVSYFVDMGSMFILIGGLNMMDFWAKLWTQILVVIANYVFSKVFIFKSVSKL